MAIDRSEELCFTQEAWEAVMRPLSAGDRVVASGRLTINDIPSNHTRVFLCSELTVGAEWPQARTWPPLSEHCVVATSSPPGPTGLRGVLERIRPLENQIIVVLLLACGPNQDGWNAGVFHRGKIRPLDGVRVTGPGMPAFRRLEPDINVVDPEAAQRLSRLEGVIGPDAIRIVSSLRVAQAGAGRNGSEIATRLGPLVRSYRFFDPDRLEIENLDATIGAARADVGRPKVDVLFDRLHALRGESILVSPLEMSAAEPGVIDMIRDADVLITATDSDTPRAAFAMLANRFQKIHLDVGTSVTEEDGDLRYAGDVRFFYPGQGCVFCCGGLRNEDDALYELFSPSGSLSRRPPQPWHSLRRGSSSALNSIVCGTAVQILLDAITGHQRTSTWHRLRWHQGAGLETIHGPVGPSPDCRLCGRNSIPT